MVQIVLQPTNSLKEWTLVEYQGELNSRLGNGFCGNKIGDLHFNSKGDPIMIIGHHILYGKVKKLEKPFAVLVKNKDAEMDQREYLIKAVITNKLIFSLRPKPIIIHVPKKV
uniref:Chromosome transmission fidelity protein 8 homolog n=1 Tax=Ciona intestinalis TaxID=7719 RepID=H2XRH0_CIOIN|nr:chromosome transmission fidelity protein 8 homolog [Ciona intestinalis]|eukprot:XP_009858572.1 chromosome transmission fidelity protein 8 homolog [Ciona intestinalis]